MSEICEERVMLMHAYDDGFVISCGFLVRDESSARRERGEMIGEP